MDRSERKRKVFVGKEALSTEVIACAIYLTHDPRLMELHDSTFGGKTLLLPCAPYPHKAGEYVVERVRGLNRYMMTMSEYVLTVSNKVTDLSLTNWINDVMWARNHNKAVIRLYYDEEGHAQLDYLPHRFLGLNTARCSVCAGKNDDNVHSLLHNL